MDWLRSCYRSKWRLIRGNPYLREGFYYFVPANTPFYPGIHLLGSRHWTSDERVPEPTLGEYSGPQKWWRGDPPNRPTLPVRVGTEDCIANGEPGPVTIVTDKSAFCGEILPLPCYDPLVSTWAQTNVLDCLFAKQSADIIGAAYTDPLEAAFLAFIYLGDTWLTQLWAVEDINVPRFLTSAKDDTIVLFITGTTNFQQLAFQAFYFGTGPIDQGPYSSNFFDENAAIAILTRINLLLASGFTRFVFVGHSFGGAVAVVMAARMRATDPTRRIEILTFGAPAAGDQRLHDLIAPLHQMHYANVNDPVPYMPPRGITFAALTPIIGPVLSLLWPQFVRAPNVRTVTEDGQFIDERTEDLPQDALFAASTAIAAGLDAPHFKDHDIDWYAYYICKACACVPKPCVSPFAVDPFDSYDFFFSITIQDNPGAPNTYVFNTEVVKEFGDLWGSITPPPRRAFWVPIYEGEEIRGLNIFAHIGDSPIGIDIVCRWTFPVANWGELFTTPLRPLLRSSVGDPIPDVWITAFSGLLINPNP